MFNSTTVAASINRPVDDVYDFVRTYENLPRWASGIGENLRRMPVSINDDNFDSEVMRSDLPVVLDVWSASCGPCKKLEPIMMALTRTYQGRVKICEMAVHKGMRSAAQLDVRGTPTVLYLKDGKELERIVGFRGSLYHEETIEELFGILSRPT